MVDFSTVSIGQRREAASSDQSRYLVPRDDPAPEGGVDKALALSHAHLLVQVPQRGGRGDAVAMGTGGTPRFKIKVSLAI